jgi:uncharacterized protein (DUF427 family)
LELCPLRVRVEFGGETIADSEAAYRLLETSHPPTFYIPSEDVRREFLTSNARRSFCEFKGNAKYWDLLADGRMVRDAAWSYASPNPPYEQIRDHFSFYASRMDACYVGAERVQPQAGDFYGGWITANIVGPFKGGPGTRFW